MPVHMPNTCTCVIHMIVFDHFHGCICIICMQVWLCKLHMHYTWKHQTWITRVLIHTYLIHFLAHKKVFYMFSNCNKYILWVFYEHFRCLFHVLFGKIRNFEMHLLPHQILDVLLQAQTSMNTCKLALSIHICSSVLKMGICLVYLSMKY